VVVEATEEKQQDVDKISTEKATIFNSHPDEVDCNAGRPKEGIRARVE
jgi:hypothetical protein